MTGALRKGLFLLVVIFIGFYLFTDPHGLASFTRAGGGHVWDGLSSLFSAVITFLNDVSH
ncbi:hypothetical protein [Nocardioides terrisoli]|uniref:hypothetical protein n=1 Tax=Nocardioides terrisoli TaxID=3388267 RepID=UPI00287B9CE7|nr:hypothetical protein [Nocardioides marmorisolisilvae]